MISFSVLLTTTVAAAHALFSLKGCCGPHYCVGKKRRDVTVWGGETSPECIFPNIGMLCNVIRVKIPC